MLWLRHQQSKPDRFLETCQVLTTGQETFMTSARKTYTRQFKLEAIGLADTSGKAVSQVERELGLPKGMIFRWRHALACEGANAFPGQGHRPSAEESVRQLERENLLLREERDALIKAIALLSPKPST